MNRARLAAFIFGSLTMALIPSLALAQSSISGVIKDATGAVVAGAKVEASSDVLIEKTRTQVSNGEGRYSMIDLRPGTYVVTATAPGFDTVRQTIEVPANVTVPVDATLKVGSVGETVNVESRVATVDIENAAHPETLTRSEMDDLPSGRYMQSIASYVPGAHLNVPDIGGSQQIEQNYISVHGNGSTHDTYMLDGMLVNTTYADGQIQQYIDNAAIQESTYQTSNVTAEASGGGMFTNLIPRDGGNQFHFNFFAGGSGSGGLWQADNVTPQYGNRGVTGQSAVARIMDFDGALGGPVMKDKLWFTLTGRAQETLTQAGGSFYPNGSPGIQDGYLFAGTFRLTYQVNQNNKVSAFFLRNWKYKGHEIVDGQGGIIPADPSVSSTQRNKWPMYYILQTRWTGTPTAKLVVQAGISISHLDYNDVYQQGVGQTPFTPAWFANTTQVDSGNSRRYLAGANNDHFITTRNVLTATANYALGQHALKFGAQYSFGPAYFSRNINGDGTVNFNSGTDPNTVPTPTDPTPGLFYSGGIPINFTAQNTPFNQKPYLTGDMGLFGMDTWHFKRLSVTAGLRFEYLAAEIQDESVANGRFVAARTIAKTTCDTLKGMGCWKDWAPRLGVVYDLFGNHKTAIKAGFGKYNSQYSTSFTNNFNPMQALTEAVAWNFPSPYVVGSPCAPVKFNGVFAPNPLCFPVGGFAPQGTTTAQIPLNGLGPSSNPAFGSITSPSLDPNFHRDYNLQYTFGIQQEVYKGVTLNLNWYRRSSYQAVLLDNNAITNGQWVPTTINNPLDGSAITVYNLPISGATPAPVLFQTNAPQSLVRDVYTGYEASIVARLKRGAFVNFGWTVDRQLDRNCAEGIASITGARVNDPNTLRFCDQFGDSSVKGPNGVAVSSIGAVPSPPWANEFTAQGSIPIKWGVVGSVSFLSNRYQGNFASGTTGAINNGWLARTWTVTAGTKYPTGCVGCLAGLPPLNSAGAPATCANIGQAVVGCTVDAGISVAQGSAEVINLVAPGQVLTPRLNQLDFSLKRTFKFREKYVFEPQAQVFNILNSNAAVTQTTSLGGTTAPFLTPAACAASTNPAVSGAVNCGLGGQVTTITNPRLLRLALLFRF